MNSKYPKYEEKKKAREEVIQRAIKEKSKDCSNKPTLEMNLMNR